MRPLMIVLVVVALSIAVVTAYLIRNLLSTQPPQTAPVAAPVQTVPTQKVLVAARDIASGGVLMEEDVRYEEWPQTLIDKRYIAKIGTEDPKARVIGSVAARHIQAGEPLTGTAVFRQDEAGQLSAMIGPGMRAVSISVSGLTAVAGFVVPGDRVDILLVTDFQDQASGTGSVTASDPLHVSEVFLRDVRVVAIDTNLRTGGVNQAGALATLEVTPKDAERLILSGLDSKFHLVLRSQISGDTLETDDLNNDVIASRAMQTYSIWAAKLGLMAKKEPEPGPEMPFDDSAAGRGVKLNRAGIIETRVFH